MHLCHYEDHAESFEPLTLTRPVFDLRCGLATLGEKQRRYFGATHVSVIVRPTLAEWYARAHPDWTVNGEGNIPGDDLVLVNGRWLPPTGSFARPESACVGFAGDQIAYVYLPRAELGAIELATLLRHSLETAPHQDAGGTLVSYPWDLVALNGDEITRDLAGRCLHENTHADRPIVLIGPRENVWIAPTARVEPLVAIDATRGPVVIDEGAVVTAFTRLEGPCWIGPHAHVLGAKIRARTTIGPHCRVGGEVEASILHGYSNKYHEGFLGHSYVGEWVNLAAGTHNSDLRNDYGEVSVLQFGAPVATGMTKVGCFIGDHTKTGLGTLINTGTTIGAFCNLLPAGRYAPRYLPSFTSWWNARLCEAFTLEQLLTTASIAMSRRGVALTAPLRAFYAELYAATANERRQSVREMEPRVLRKSA